MCLSLWICCLFSVCFVSKITFAILPKSAADFLHTGSPCVARADNQIKYYVPTININCIALYRVEYIYRNLVGNFRANYKCILIAAKTQIQAWLLPMTHLQSLGIVWVRINRILSVVPHYHQVVNFFVFLLLLFFVAVVCLKFIEECRLLTLNVVLGN